MRLGSLALLSLLFCSPVIAAEGWQAIPGAPTAGRLDDLHFLDENRGWVCDSSGEIFHTTDAGASWALQLSVTDYMRTIYFADEQNGFAGTLGPQLLYRTTDAGTHWIAVPNASIPSPRPQAVCGMGGVGDMVYGTGAYFGPAVLIRSTDRGASWSSVDMSPYARNLVDCYFTSPNEGFAVGGSPGPVSQSKPVILQTTDGGTTWTTRYLGTLGGAYCWKVFFVNSLVGYVSVYAHDAAIVLRTKNGGQAWSAMSISGISDLEGIGFATELHGWVDGWNGSSQTANGGVTWQPFTIDGGGSVINRYQFFGPGRAVAVGYTVFRYDSTADAPTELAAASPSLFDLRAFPNPTGPRARIAFTLPASSRAQLRIYDSLGRELRSIDLGDQAAGAHEVEWDGIDARGEAVASGFYLYRLDAGGRAESRSFTLIR